MSGPGAQAARNALARAIFAYDAAVERVAVDGKRENERAVRFAAEAVVTAARRALKHIAAAEGGDK